MRRCAIGLTSLLLAACGSILGVEPLTHDERPVVDAGTDAAPIERPDDFDAAPRVVDASSFVDAASDAQCFATAATPPRSVTSGGDGNPWIQLDDMALEDGKNAVGGGCCFGDTTQTATANDFGFDLPSDAQIQGVTIRVKALSSPGGVARDNSISLVADGKAGDDLKIARPWDGSYETRVYGSPTNLDGLALTADAVNSPHFGVALSATKPPFSSGQTTFEVDVLQVTVFYCH